MTTQVDFSELNNLQVLGGDYDASPYPRDPARLGFPPTLPLEIALRSASTRDICEAYGLSRADWDDLRADKSFQMAVREAADSLRESGMTFRTKAMLQAEELLKTSWKLIHDRAVPAAVRADLIKFTVRAAGLDYSKEQGQQAPLAHPLQINISL